MSKSPESPTNPYISDSEGLDLLDDPRNPRLRIAVAGVAGTLIGGVLVGGGVAIYNSSRSEQPFNPDRCGQGSPTPGKGGNSAVYHAFENMKPSVAVSDQTIATLGRQANILYGDTIDISDRVEVCVDLESGVAKVTKPTSAE